MNEPQPAEDRQRTRRQLSERAVVLAMQNKWDEAAAVNKRIVDEYTPDTESWNRLGKAYSQLGRISEARHAYNEALRLDPTNSIAQRNLQRLAVLKDVQETVEAEGGESRSRRIDPRFFIEETGKTTARAIYSDAPREVLARVAAGEGVDLRKTDDVLVVLTVGGERLGALDSKLSKRLMELMAGGNQYRAALIGVEGRQVRLLIRETYQAPSMLGRVSFPAEGTGTATVRPLRDLARADEVDDDDIDIEGDGEADEALDEPDFVEEPEA